MTRQYASRRLAPIARYIADDRNLVIFDSGTKRNYSFSYVPRGDTLELSYAGEQIEMKAAE